MSNYLAQSQHWLKALNASASQLPQGQHAKFMEVCGTHTMAAFRCGLHSLTPENVTLLSGPGCPVCVTAQGDIDQIIKLAEIDGATICTYGDMIRVPGQSSSLERARSEGADVRVVYSTMDAVKLAQKHPEKQVVFAAVGFETTAPATAAAIKLAAKRKLENFTVLASHKWVMPAMMALLASGDIDIDGFLLPGHVSVIIGTEAFRPIVDQYNLPCVVSGFEDFQMTQGLARLTQQVVAGKAELVNDYPQVVKPGGNPTALALLDEIYDTCDASWRGLGVIPDSGMMLKDEFDQFNAAKRFNLDFIDTPEPAGCLCGDVIKGMATPAQCKLFGKACTPINPIGPCMVSSEGTCQAWFKYNRPLKPLNHAPVYSTTQENTQTVEVPA
ncbi:MAG: hydrogenase formation protein HypD [Phycisphaeraceae bacterium JB051]